MPVCRACESSFEISPHATRLLEKFPGEPEPSYCFTCAQKRRMMFRNGTSLYHRTCDLTGERIISIFAPEKPYRVYKADAWWSDKWDARTYGRDVNFNRPFFEQFRALQLEVPRLALTNIKSVNSDYCGMCEGNKNCYMVFGGDHNEDCMYGIFNMRNRNCVDCDVSNHNEQCYFLSDSYYCYDTSFAFDCLNCNSCAFVSDCIGCTDCILCTNLAKRSHCVRNQQCMKEEFEKQKQVLLSGSYRQQQLNWEELLRLRKERIVKNLHILRSEDCSGDYIEGSKDCENCFEVWDCQDLVDVILAFDAKDSFYSGCIGHGSELCFDAQSTFGAYDTRHSFSIFDSNGIRYCDFVVSSRNLFGCTGMNRASYCLLNKQYSEEEYERLVPRVVEHMRHTGEYGEFFPVGCSCFGYNEGTGMMYFPLTETQAREEGLPWFEVSEEPLTVTKTIDASQLPDSINDTPDDIANWVILSEESKKPFKVVPQELKFLRSMRLPVPRINFEERHKLRRSLRNLCGLYSRTCAQCGREIETTYAPDRPETVYCESCYRKEVF